MKEKNNYRKIWEDYHGGIPLDSCGRSYEIHHIDGDHDNNVITNLACVTIQEHYDIHYAQGDWSACLMISSRMNIDPEEKSRLARLFQEERVKAGTHHWLRREDGSSHASDMVKNGTHNWQGEEYAEKQRALMINAAKEGTHPFQQGHQTVWNLKRVEDGTHPWAGENGKLRNLKLLEEGKHNSRVEWVCEHCNKSGKGISNYKQYHGDNCLVVNPNRSTSKKRVKSLERKTCEHCGLETSISNYKKYHGDNCLVVKPDRNFKNSRYDRIKPYDTCPHCGVSCDGGNYRRYHGDNCKHKLTANAVVD
jgi:hypothetical protein